MNRESEIVYLQDGKVVPLKNILDHYWTFSGPVEEGIKRGRTLGFPTLNFNLPDKKLKFGVYAVYLSIVLDHHATLYGGVANFGVTPMFKRETPLLEVHVFDFSSFIYGQTVSIFFVHYLREEKTFLSSEHLIEAIQDDCVTTKRILEKENLKF